jgi:ATP-dependent helicase/nuclease subunit A
MNPVQNRSISASAGTGKTFRLAHRYIGLMAAGVAPDRICALTFSRKAAGEIFDKIVEHLCAAVAMIARRAQRRNDCKEGLPPRPRADDYLAPAANPARPRPPLRSAPRQLHSRRRAQRSRWNWVSARDHSPWIMTAAKPRPLVCRFSLASSIRDLARGEPAGSVPQRFPHVSARSRDQETVVCPDQLVRTTMSFNRRTALRRALGRTDRIWPRPTVGGARPDDAPPPDTLAESLRAMFGETGRPGQLGKNLSDVTDAALSHAIDRPWPQRKDKVALLLLQNAGNLQPPTLSYYGKEYVLPQPLWDGVRFALRHAINVEIGRALTQTQGLRTVLGRYDECYAAAQTHDGHFTFEDLSRLLGSGGPSPSRVPDAENRLYIDYRLDGRLDHWLMDEFQDTSDTQWETLANLVDEVIQDDARSFFFVGDIKQSIYGWRGGNYRLFNKIQEKYQSCGARAIVSESIQSAPLAAGHH